ncbi:MAG: hypothetical protein ACTSU9_19775 [Promethearchaeota archaeon]
MNLDVNVPPSAGMMEGVMVGAMDKMQDAGDVRTARKKLAASCLKFKWTEDQEKALSLILSPCSFCNDTYFREGSCGDCLCPPAICSNNGKDGLVGYIFRKYGNVYACDIGTSDYGMVRRVLVHLSIHGVLGRELERAVSEFCSTPRENE